MHKYSVFKCRDHEDHQDAEIWLEVEMSEVAYTVDTEDIEIIVIQRQIQEGNGHWEHTCLLQKMSQLFSLGILEDKSSEIVMTSG